ncbi:MAG: NRDE family protein [bacterium]
MCLIVFAWKMAPDVPLIAAANRDEFLDRPTAPAMAWDDYPQIYAGRDLQAGGTWMGITQPGRFAAITNIRAPSEKRADAPSRGNLVADFLCGNLSPQSYIDAIQNTVAAYNGFNLLVGDREQLIWFSNRGTEDARNGQPLAPGIYGISNALLDTPWPKVVRTKAQFASLMCQRAPEEAYFDMLFDTTRAASDCRLPKTGIDIELERLLSAPYIQAPNYGTRASTLVWLNNKAPSVLIERIPPHIPPTQDAQSEKLHSSNIRRCR